MSYHRTLVREKMKGSSRKGKGREGKQIQIGSQRTLLPVFLALRLSFIDCERVVNGEEYDNTFVSFRSRLIGRLISSIRAILDLTHVRLHHSHAHAQAHALTLSCSHLGTSLIVTSVSFMPTICWTLSLQSPAIALYPLGNGPPSSNSTPIVPSANCTCKSIFVSTFPMVVLGLAWHMIGFQFINGAKKTFHTSWDEAWQPWEYCRSFSQLAPAVVDMRSVPLARSSSDCGCVSSSGLPIPRLAAVFPPRIMSPFSTGDLKSTSAQT
jgi:hypothetical protein|eukprot:COSAG06_NODE_2409_length_6926_cov_2.496411_9_plen_267_part_00